VKKKYQAQQQHRDRDRERQRERMGVAMERLASCGAVYVTHAVSTKTYDVGFCPKSCCILGPVKKKKKTHVGLRVRGFFIWWVFDLAVCCGSKNGGEKDHPKN
jgi:hypothetical protein